jgi:hypothetical protein
MPSFSGTPAVTFGFTGASDSTARTIPAADAVFLAGSMWEGTGATVTTTIAGAAPVESYQAISAGGELAHLAIFLGVPTGSQTVVIDDNVGSNNGWSVGYRGLDSVDPLDPMDGQVTDTASPLSINVATTLTGLACGVIMADSTAITTSDDEVFEGPISNTSLTACASTPGDGGTVAIDWSGATVFISIAVNLRDAIAAESEVIGRVNRSSVPPNVRLG